MQNDEIWKPVLGFEDRYEISNLGRVRSRGFYMQKWSRWGHYVSHYNKPRMMSISNCSNGYKFVTLCGNDGEQSMKLVHRLVAEAFLPNPNNYPCVNHKDETRTNNCVDNLEWCTHSYNNSYGGHRRKTVEAIRKGRSDKWRPKFVLQYSLDFELIAVYPSIIEASRRTGCDKKNIFLSAKNGIKTKAKTFYWKTLDVKELPQEYKPYLVQ